MTPGYAKSLGVDVDNLLVSQPDSGEQALVNHRSAGSLGCDRCYLFDDSVAALCAQGRSFDGEDGRFAHGGSQARLMSQALRKRLRHGFEVAYRAHLHQSNSRKRLASCSATPRRRPAVAPVRIDIRRIAAVKRGRYRSRVAHKVKIVKNKVAAPFREAGRHPLRRGHQPRRRRARLAACNVVEKNGAWYVWRGDIGQGRENTRSFLKENKDIYAKIDAELRKRLNIGAAKADVLKRLLAARQKQREVLRGKRPNAF